MQTKVSKGVPTEKRPTRVAKTTGRKNKPNYPLSGVNKETGTGGGHKKESAVGKELSRRWCADNSKH